MKNYYEGEKKAIKLKAEIQAVEFVKSASQKIMKAVTREYRELLQQYLDFREQTWTVIDGIKDYGDRMVKAEQLTSQ